MLKKINTTFKILLLLVIFVAPFLVLAQTATPNTKTPGKPFAKPEARSSSGTFNYIPMEKLPGMPANASTDFYTYVSYIYKFGPGAIGICAMLMIIIGGYMYLASAGNNASMEKAKGVITDAIVGLTLALASYLILYVINPDLVKIKRIEPVPTPTQTSGGAQWATGSCSAVKVGACTPANLQNTCFKNDSLNMSMICNIESSGGNPSKESGTDKCKDGAAWSIGLFQINMINSATSVGCNGKEIFEVIGTTRAQGDCLEWKTNSKGLKYCAISNCRVINQAKYNDCKAKLVSPTTNIQAACSLYSARKYKPWLNTANICGIK